MFGNVFILEISDGTTTDLDGQYSYELPPGIYTMEYSYIGYANTKVTDVKIVAGEVTIMDIKLSEDAQLLEEVVVTGEQIKNTEIALATLQRKSVNLLDGISSQTFRKIGDSDAAGAIKRVTGVSVQGGKYVYVRGLGDRYTKSVLNGMEIPGLDPDRNALQMDLFPTNILDNIIVLKTFTADLPADFTGGIVDVKTKSFPESKALSINGGIGYNPSMHFNPNFRTYEGSNTDIFGFDDGRRDIPTGRSENIPFRSDAIVDPEGAGKTYSNILQGFDQVMASKAQSSFMDYNFGFSFGNQKDLSNTKKLGFSLAASYKNETSFYEDIEYNRFGKNNSNEILELQQRESQVGDLGINNVTLSAMGGLAFKTTNHKLILNVLRLQNGESKAAKFNYENSDQGANYTAAQDNLEYSQRSISNLLFSGSHAFNGGKNNLTWATSPTLSEMSDPDIRVTKYRTDGTNLTIGTEVGLPERIWRYLDETNISNKVDLENKLTLFGNQAKFKIGSSYYFKDRNYEIQNFQIRTNKIELTGDADEIFSPDNLWSGENTGGTTYDPTFIPVNPNKYQSDVNNIAGYLSMELEPVKNLKAVLGVRFENYVQRYTGVNQEGDEFNDVKVLDNQDLFPTANLIYALNDKRNLRFSFTKTVARPSFKEASFATIIDPLSGRSFIGSFFPDINVSTGEVIWDGNLKQTDISNIDLRFETFGDRGDMFSVSTFYKGFKNPIEMVQYIQAANNFQPRNVGDAQVIGAEIEVIKGLGAISSKLADFKFNTNITYVQSQVDMSATEYQSRLDNARVGEDVDSKRAMAGQAPYLINTGLSYKSPEGKYEVGAFYNVQGKTLQYVGIADRPDVYSMPFHSLNINGNYSFGSNDQYSLGLKVKNLLGDSKDEVFTSFGAEDAFFTRLRPNTSFSLSFKYTIK
jgi:TonB-dependent receptor